jgi:hypothetical protein
MQATKPTFLRRSIDHGGSLLIGTLNLRNARMPVAPAFAAVAALVVGLGALALGRSGDATVVVTAVTVDIVLAIPAVYYVLLVRGGGLPAITLLPVFRLCLLVAGLVLPADDRMLYELIAPSARIAELAIASYVVYRLRLGWRAFRSAATPDVLERYRTAVRATLPATVPAADRAAAAIAFENALIWYAMRAWRARAETPAGATAFSGHRKSSYAGVVAGLLVAVGCEVVVMHLLVSRWSPGAAWVLTALGIYGAVWLVGDLQAIRLRPTWLDGERLCMRLGLRWIVTVPRRHVRRVRKLGRADAVDGALRLTLPNAPRVLVELNTPAPALGAYGIERTVSAIELGVDDGDEFVSRFGPA